MPVYRCATCQREVTYEGKLPALYPFCGRRCKLVDLARWLREEYSIDRDLTPEDLPTGSQASPPADADQ